jgi:hypothetical protein
MSKERPKDIVEAVARMINGEMFEYDSFTKIRFNDTTFKATNKNTQNEEYIIGLWGCVTEWIPMEDEKSKLAKEIARHIEYYLSGKGYQLTTTDEDGLSEYLMECFPGVFKKEPKDE